jgi:hypothetical protein
MVLVIRHLNSEIGLTALTFARFLEVNWPDLILNWKRNMSKINLLNFYHSGLVTTAISTKGQSSHGVMVVKIYIINWMAGV